jgi:hypothetical protein
MAFLAAMNIFGSKATPGKEGKPPAKSDTGCDMSQEELLALLKGISYEKPKSKVTEQFEEECYVAPSAMSVLCAELDGEPEAETEAGDFASRFSSKAWKSRAAAFEEAKLLFENGDGTEAIFRTWAPFMAAAADDSNASANDAGLDMITAWSVIFISVCFVDSTISLPTFG